MNEPMHWFERLLIGVLCLEAGLMLYALVWLYRGQGLGLGPL